MHTGMASAKSSTLASLESLVEKLVKQYKQHRSAEVFDRKFVLSDA